MIGIEPSDAPTSSILKAEQMQIGQAAGERTVPPLYPALIVAAFMAHGAIADALPLAWSWRSILLVGIGVIVIQAAMSLVLRSRQRGAVAALVLASWLLGEPTAARGILLCWLAAEALEHVGRLRRRPSRAFERGTRFVNTAAIVLGILTTLSLVNSELGDRPRATLGEPASGSDIFVILLDAYPRADTLAERYDFDNRDFLRELERRGFDVAEASQSNYNLTPLTLASMLEMRHLDDIPGLPRESGKPEQRRALRTILGQPEAVRVLREQGYAVKVIASPFPVWGIRSADDYLDSGQLNFFEIGKLVQASAHGPLGRSAASVLAHQHRDRINAAFDLLEADQPGGRPRFVFAHVMAPHAPFIFGAKGEDLPLQACFPQHCGFWDGWTSQLKRADFAVAATRQITYTNGRVLAAVDAILANAVQPPVIVVMSDHGSRLDPADPDEMLHNLFAAYTPGHSQLFGDDAMPVMVFPRILGAYFGIDVPEPDRRQFYLSMADASGPLDYVPYPAK